jgi:hypothetical protein
MRACLVPHLLMPDKNINDLLRPLNVLKSLMTEEMF